MPEKKEQPASVPVEKSTEEKLRDTVIEILGVNAEQVTKEASFMSDIGADSLDCVEIVMNAEEVFGIELPDAAFEGKEDLTFGELLKMVEEKLS